MVIDYLFRVVHAAITAITMMPAGMFFVVIGGWLLSR